MQRSPVHVHDRGHDPGDADVLFWAFEVRALDPRLMSAALIEGELDGRPVSVMASFREACDIGQALASNDGPVACWAPAWAVILGTRP